MLLVLAVGIGGCSTGSAKPGAKRSGWIEVQAGDIRVISQLSEKKTRELGRNLVRFQEVAGKLLGGTRIEPRIETELVVTASRRVYHEDAKGSSETAGYFLSGVRRNIAVAYRSRGTNLTEVILHEYVHFLQRNGGRVRVPAWYDEGFAQFLMGTKFEKDVAKIGSIPLASAQLVQNSIPLPVAEVVSAKNLYAWSDTRTARFYATSWELVHYLILSSPTREKFPLQLASYLRATGEGADPAQSFEDAFGLSTEDADRKLSIRRTRGFPTLAMPLPPGGNTLPGVRPMDQAEVDLVFGNLNLARGAYTEARSYFEKALERRPAMPRALSGLADTWKFEGEFDKARPLFERAIALAPQDALIQLDMGEFYDSLSRASEDPDEQRRLRLEERTHYARANQIAPDMPETFLVNGVSHARDAEQDPEAMQKALASLEHAHFLLPGSFDVSWALASGYLQAGDREAAEAMIAALGAEGHSRGRGEEVASLREQLEKIR